MLRDHVQGQDGVVGRRDDIVHPGRPHGHAEAEHGRVPVCTGLQQVGTQARTSATSQGMQSEEALGRVTWLKGLLQRIVQLRVVLGPVHTEAVGPVVACSGHVSDEGGVWKQLPQWGSLQLPHNALLGVNEDGPCPQRRKLAVPSPEAIGSEWYVRFV